MRKIHPSKSTTKKVEESYSHRIDTSQRFVVSVTKKSNGIVDGQEPRDGFLIVCPKNKGDQMKNENENENELLGFVQSLIDEIESKRISSMELMLSYLKSKRITLQLESKFDRRDEINEFIEMWNASGFPRMMQLTTKRKALLRRRMQEEFFRRNWKDALDKIKQSSFCCGENNRGWRANFDWFILPNSITKIMEGMYDNRELIASKSESESKIRSIMDCDSIIRSCEQEIASIRGDSKNFHKPNGEMVYILKPEKMNQVKMLRAKIEEVRKKKLQMT